MKSKRALALAAGLSAAFLGVGCIDIMIAGFPLGPQGGTGLAIRGVIAPQVSTTGCLYATGSPLQLYGALDMGDGATYIGVLDVTNNLPNNKSTATAPSFGGNYGSQNTNNVEVITAHVRYEFPTESPLDGITRTLTNPDLLLAGTPLVGASHDAQGNLLPGGSTAIPVTLVDEALMKIMMKNSQIKSKAAKNGFPVVAKVTLEGRSDQGTRVTSNELAFKVVLWGAGHLVNCATLDQYCGTQPPITNPPKTSTRNTAGPCILGQDIPECVFPCH